MKYRVGQKVVYIGPDFSGHPLIVLHRTAVPVVNGIYTIRGGMVLPHGIPGYVFDEISNPVVMSDCGIVMETHCDEPFLRPLIERKTDISVFREILRKADRRVRV